MRSVTFLIVALLFLAAAPAAPAGDAVSIVKYRQATMKAMAAHMTAMSLIVKKGVNRQADLVTHAESIRGLSGGLVTMFPAGSDTAHVTTAAKQAIWLQAADFASASRKLETEIARLVALAKSRDSKAFEAQFDKVATTCSDCHSRFRVRDSD